MSNKDRLRLLVGHMFIAGFQAMAVIWNIADRHPFMVFLCATAAFYSAFCAYEFYGKILEDPEPTP